MIGLHERMSIDGIHCVSVNEHDKSIGGPVHYYRTDSGELLFGGQFSSFAELQFVNGESIVRGMRLGDDTERFYAKDGNAVYAPVPKEYELMHFVEPFGDMTLPKYLYIGVKGGISGVGVLDVITTSYWRDGTSFDDRNEPYLIGNNIAELVRLGQVPRFHRFYSVLYESLVRENQLGEMYSVVGDAIRGTIQRVLSRGDDETKIRSLDSTLNGIEGYLSTKMLHHLELWREAA